MKSEDRDRLVREKERTKRALVLVVEENPMQQKLYSLLSAKVGMVPFIVENCEDACNAAQKLDFDMVIIDLDVPRTKGVECARQLRELDKRNNKKTPLVAITAHVMPGDRESCIKSGLDDYLAVPFTLDQLREKISEWAA